MRKIYLKSVVLLISLVFYAGISKAQYVTIPDTNFRNWLTTNYPACMSGGQLDTTCPAVVNAQVVAIINRKITDLTGIRYFDNLNTLFCHNNQLTSLPVLPANLQQLYCEYNLLKSLKNLPQGLAKLNCRNNRLRILRCLPQSLTYLACGLNQLKKLPSLPQGLTYLDCSNNKLKMLPKLPQSLTVFDCANNRLKMLPTPPPSLMELNCANNPTLNCLPYFTQTMLELIFNNTGIQCVPPVSATNSTPALTTVPVCSSSFNPHNCPLSPF